jgi:hypothetical protein
VSGNQASTLTSVGDWVVIIFARTSVPSCPSASTWLWIQWRGTICRQSVGAVFLWLPEQALSRGLISAHGLDWRRIVKKPFLCFDFPAGFTGTFLHCRLFSKCGVARRQQRNNLAANSISSLLDLDKKKNVNNLFYGRRRRTAVVQPFGYGRQNYSFERQWSYQRSVCWRWTDLPTEWFFPTLIEKCYN